MILLSALIGPPIMELFGTDNDEVHGPLCPPDICPEPDLDGDGTPDSDDADPHDPDIQTDDDIDDDGYMVDERALFVGNKVILFEHCITDANFPGYTKNIEVTADGITEGRSEGDSAIHIPLKTVVILTDAAGETLILKGPKKVHCLVDMGWNDRIKSIEVLKESTPPTCDDSNASVLADGSCGPCKTGYILENDICTESDDIDDDDDDEDDTGKLKYILWGGGALLGLLVLKKIAS